LEMDYYELAYRINDAIGNTSLANSLFRLYTEKKESQFGDLPRNILAEWELATENEKRTKELAFFELQSVKESKEKYIVVLTAGLLLLGLSFLFLTRYRKQKIDKQRISFELELKSKPLVSESLKNITVENTKEELLFQLEEIVAELPKMHQVKFENIKNSLKFKKSMAMLTEFETRFNSVYEYFYSQLKALAPDLTPNELRICALMRLNITTKEIALLTNRSIGTIDNTRSSIRKKLKIDEETNLQEFLMNI
jgi:DNA-binding CsgD family transcriptional regulator